MTTEKILRKTIITSAVTGAVHSLSMSEHLPVTPKQIADDAVRSYEAGAAIAHIHARIPETGEPTADLKIFREIVADIKSRCSVIVCLTTGGAGSVKERIAVVPEFKPEMATLNCGTMNGGARFFNSPQKEMKYRFEWEEKRDKGMEKNLFENTYANIRKYAQIERENGAKPELEIYDVGQLSAARWLLAEGLVDRPLRMQFVMGGFSGMPAEPGMLLFVHEQARKTLGEFTWSICSGGRNQLAMSAVALAIGGDVRVGMEDSLFAGYGRLCKSSAEQVERVVTIARALSIEPATPDEAREMLGLKGMDKVNF